MTLQQRHPLRPVRGRHYPVAVVALIAAAAAATAGVTLTVGGSGHRSAAATLGSRPPLHLEAPAVTQQTAMLTTLPQPTGHIGAVPIGYPQTLAGAVSAAYGYSHIATSLDAATAVRTVDSIADPAAGWFNPAKRDEAVAGVVAQRQKLGLGPVGPNGKAALTVTPSGYQIWGRPTPTAAVVLTLNVVSMVGTDGATTLSGLLVYRWALRWDGTRWRARTVYVNDADQSLAATPLTALARGKGWQEADGG